MTSSRTAVDIPIRPWFRDHSFNGMAVLPAVETLSLLAQRAVHCRPDLDVRVMKQVRFSKFLVIPPQSHIVEAQIESSNEADGSVHFRLLSRKKLRNMTRLQEHGEVQFSPAKEKPLPNPGISPVALTTTEQAIKADTVYRDLVPFGPAYQTLEGTVFLSGQGALGRLKAPELPVAECLQQLIGSPFPLDGAMHAACVLGQHYVDFIPFPVGFESRTIYRPTRPGFRYQTKVIPDNRTPDQLVFDLGIFDENGGVYETVTGLRMKDVSRAAAGHHDLGQDSALTQTSNLSMETLVSQRRKTME